MAHVGCVRCWTKDSKGQPPLKVQMSHSHVVKVEKKNSIVTMFLETDMLIIVKKK